MQTPNAAVAAIQFALETDDGLAFLRCWNEGNFDTIRREWLRRFDCWVFL